MKKDEVIIYRQKIAEIIQNTRVQKGIEIGIIAKETGFSESTIRRIESGVFAPSIDQFLKICEILKVAIILNDDKIM